MGRLFRTALTPDEHYTPNVLRASGIEFAREDVTLISRMTCKNGHPEIMECSSAQQVDQFRRFLGAARARRKLFARKLAPSCVAYLEASEGWMPNGSMPDVHNHGPVSHAADRLNADEGLVQVEARSTGSTPAAEVQPAVERRIRPLLVLLVLSTRTKEGRRRREAQLRSWPPAVRPPDLMRVLSVLGDAPSMDEEGLHTNASGVEELHLAVPEKYALISLKVLRALRWLYQSRNALAPAYVAKTDDDTYVCVGTLLHYLVDATKASFSHGPGPGSPVYMGHFGPGNQVYTNKPGWKWNDPGYVSTFNMTVSRTHMPCHDPCAVPVWVM